MKVHRRLLEMGESFDFPKESLFSIANPLSWLTGGATEPLSRLASVSDGQST